MSVAALYNWPATAKFGRVVPKTKIYEHGAVTAALRKKFVTDIQRITWAYKLAEATIHLCGGAAVPEIQVFVIDAKNDDISDDVLTAIDKAVRFPIIFEICKANSDRGHVRMVAAYKQLDGTRPRLSTYVSTNWFPADAPRIPLPAALDLPSLYSGLLSPMLPVTTSPGEPLSEAMARMDEARRLKREIASLDRQLQTEQQFNRKVEVYRQVRDRTATLTLLTHTARPEAHDTFREDPPWTS